MCHGDKKAEKEVSTSVLSTASENKCLAANQLMFDRAFKYSQRCGSWDGLETGLWQLWLLNRESIAVPMRKCTSHFQPPFRLPLKRNYFTVPGPLPSLVNRFLEPLRSPDSYHSLSPSTVFPIP